MCEGRSGIRILIEHAYCPAGCQEAFETLELHSHTAESGMETHVLPAVVDLHCFQMAEPAGCPGCGEPVLIALSPAE